MNTLLVFLAVSSFIFAVFSGNMSAVSAAAVSGCADAVSLVLRLCGGLCLWSGIMRLCEKSGICAFLSSLLSPVLKLIFPSLSKKSEAMHLISMNVSANLLGLGNAATPLGIAVMKKLAEINPKKYMASDDMVTFAVINSSSIQLLPTTLATLRASYGCDNPMNILPAVLITSVLSLSVGVFFAKIIPLYIGRKKQ